MSNSFFPHEELKMMKIRYNIANKKKINYPWFFLLAVSLLVISLGFVLVGLKSLSTTTKQFQDKKNELRLCEEEIETKTRKNKEHKEGIEDIKRKWKSRRKFVNNLVDTKIFPFLQRLDRLEELLPAGVFIKAITLEAETGTNLQFTLAAVSSGKLLEAYRAFLKYNLVIKREEHVEGLYNARMQIKLDN